MLYTYDHPEYFSDVLQPDYESASGNIVIFGAGVNGAIVLALLEKRGIKVLCFADDDVRKVGTDMFGYKVISREELNGKYSNSVVIVTPYISGTLFEKFDDAGLKHVYDCTPLFLEFEIEDVKKYVLPIYDVFHCVQTFLNKRSYIHDNQTMNHALTVVITERCSLRCRECMAFIPYYKNPCDYDYEQISSSLDRVLPTGVFPDIYLEGGEPFLHKDFIKILSKILSFDEVKHVWIITNGTIIPSEEILLSLKSPKVIVWISDYGKYSVKMKELKCQLLAKGISHHSTTHHWYQVTRAHKYNRTEKEMQEIYDSCCKGLNAMNPFLIKGKIYRCQFHARSEEFGVIPMCDEDCVDVFTAQESLRRKLEEFFTRKKYLQACRYCCGRGYSSNEVPVAEQALEELPPLECMKD